MTQGGERPTKYSALSDYEFVAELREHLPERSWTLAHLIELEQRGLEVVDGDPELHEALTEEFDRVRKAMEPVVKALQEQFATTLKPLQEQLSRTLKNISPKADFTPLFEGLDVGRLVSPDFASISDADLVPDVSSKLPPWDKEVARIPGGGFEAALVNRGELELESRRAQLELANTSAAQLAAIEELVQLTGSRDWFDWLLLALTAVAATGAIAAVVVAVVMN